MGVAKNCAETDEQRIARRGEGKEENRDALRRQGKEAIRT
jgi:hypothetical protein